MTIAHEIVTAVNAFLAQPDNYPGDNDTSPDDFIVEFFPGESWHIVDTVDNGNTRWEGHETQIFLLTDGSHVGIDYSYGLTENQDSRGIDGASVVVPREVVATEWVNA